MTKFDDEFIKAELEKAAEATVRPWVWGKMGKEICLLTPKNGACIVMDFVRKGMQGAQPRFSDRGNAPLGGVMINADKLDLEEHPDASLIVSSANNWEDALREMLKLRMRLDECRQYQHYPSMIQKIVDDALKGA